MPRLSGERRRNEGTKRVMRGMSDVRQAEGRKPGHNDAPQQRMDGCHAPDDLFPSCTILAPFDVLSVVMSTSFVFRRDPETTRMGRCGGRGEGHHDGMEDMRCKYPYNM